MPLVEGDGGNPALLGIPEVVTQRVTVFLAGDRVWHVREPTPGTRQPVAELDVVFDGDVLGEPPDGCKADPWDAEVAAVTVGEARLAAGREPVVVVTPRELAGARPASRPWGKHLVDAPDANDAASSRLGNEVRRHQRRGGHHVVVQEQEKRSTRVRRTVIASRARSGLLLHDHAQGEGRRERGEHVLRRLVGAVQDDDHLEPVRKVALARKRLDARGQEGWTAMGRNHHAELDLMQ